MQLNVIFLVHSIVPQGNTLSNVGLGRCQNGYYLASHANDYCTECKANTYTPKKLTGSGFTSCLPCPKGTVAPAGSSVCGVPFLK
jgi:hypothetical protein